MDTSHFEELYEGTPQSTPTVWGDSGYITATPSPFYNNSGEIIDKSVEVGTELPIRGVNETPVTSQKYNKTGNIRKHLLTDGCNYFDVLGTVSRSSYVDSEVDDNLCYSCSSSKCKENNVLESSSDTNRKLTERFSHLLVDKPVCSDVVSTSSNIEQSSNTFLERGSVKKFPVSFKSKSSVFLEKLSVKKFKQDSSFTSLQKRSPNGGSSLLQQYGCAGVSRLDFFVHLSGISGFFPGIISQILSYLSAQDLVTVCLVSTEWHRICVEDSTANQRRLAHVQHVKHAKENIIWSHFNQPGNSLNISMASGKGIFKDIQNIDRRPSVSSSPSTPRSPPVSPSKVRFNMFMKAGGALDEGAHLIRCPRCSHPSQASTDRACCQAIGCQYNFCIFCFCDIHEGSQCPTRSVASIRRRNSCIGSKESRRNLRRL